MSEYLLSATRKGLVKKTLISEYQKIRQSGLIALKLDPDDQLLATKAISSGGEVILVTSLGKSVRFRESDVRPTGRATRGVRGIKLRAGDSAVIGMDVVEGHPESPKPEPGKKMEEPELLIVTEKGVGKRTALTEYSIQGRGGQGVFTARITEKTGPVVDMRIIPSQLNADLLLISAQGQVIRLPLKDVSTLSRQTQGVKLIHLNQGDTLAALALLEKE